MPSNERTSTPLFLFAPGAGAPSSSAWMEHWATLLQQLGHVVRFDYAYVKDGRKTPDRLPWLIETHRAALKAAGERHEGPVMLIGKSMGGRVGCHVSLQEPVSAAICLGYPLCGGGDRNKLRDEVLREMRTPVLFIQGTRDKLCPLDLLAEVRSKMTAVNELHAVAGGDHSLQLTKTQLRAQNLTQTDVDRLSIAAIQHFVTDRGIETVAE